jgi:hypothetical protein
VASPGGAQHASGQLPEPKPTTTGDFHGLDCTRQSCIFATENRDIMDPTLPKSMTDPKPRSRRTTKSTPATPPRRRATRKSETMTREPLQPPPAPTMNVHFDHQTDTTRHWDGNVTVMRLVGNSVRGPQDREVAQYFAGTWRTPEDRFRFLEIGCPVRIELVGTDGTSTYWGIVEHLRITDGVIRAGRDFCEQVARFDQASRSWRLQKEQTLWPSIVFSPVPPDA